MKTTIDIPKELLKDVKIIAKIHTNREAVTVALEEFLRHHRSAELVGILGTFSDFVDHDRFLAQRGES